MFNLQTQKSEFGCAFYPALTAIVKGSKEDAANLSFERRSRILGQNQYAMTDAGQDMTGNGTGGSRLPSLARMTDTAGANPRLSEDIRFFSKLRLFTVSGYFTAIITIMSL